MPTVKFFQLNQFYFSSHRLGIGLFMFIRYIYEEQACYSKV